MASDAAVKSFAEWSRKQSANDLAKLGVVGKLAEAEIGGLVITCRVLDIRRVFGRVEVQISPVSGKGEKWVSLDGKICVHK